MLGKYMLVNWDRAGPGLDFCCIQSPDPVQDFSNTRSLLVNVSAYSILPVWCHRPKMCRKGEEQPRTATGEGEDAFCCANMKIGRECEEERGEWEWRRITNMRNNRQKNEKTSQKILKTGLFGLLIARMHLEEMAETSERNCNKLEKLWRIGNLISCDKSCKKLLELFDLFHSISCFFLNSFLGMSCSCS